MVGLYHDGISKEQTHSPHSQEAREEEEEEFCNPILGTSPQLNNPKTSHQALLTILPPLTSTTLESKLLTHETWKTLRSKL